MQEQDYLTLWVNDVEDLLRQARLMQKAGVGGRKVSLAITKLEEAQLWLASRLAELREDQHGEGNG